MPTKHVRENTSPSKPLQYQVVCYVKWLRLKTSQKYREASQEIRLLRERRLNADERYQAAHTAYLPFLDPKVPESEEKQRHQQEYWTAEESAKNAHETMTVKVMAICKEFGLAQWWDPDDTTITVKDAACIVNPFFAVVVLDPPEDKKVDFYTELRKEAHRSLEKGKVWAEPPQRVTQADKDGWLTLRVNLNEPLDESERAISQLLRINQPTRPSTRNRPDKVAEALKTWTCYEQEKSFSAVAKQLAHPVSTVKGQYLRASVLIYGQEPSGSIKQRRAGIVRDPAAEFQAHYGSCSRCQSADIVKNMCPKMKAFVNQDTKALRERLE